MKKLNLLFCENLVHSDFFLTTQNTKHNAHGVEKIIELGNKKLFSLNILNLYKEMQILIRLLTFLKKSNKNRLSVLFKEKQSFFLLTNYFKKYPIKFNIQLSNSDKLYRNNTKYVAGLLSFIPCGKGIEKDLIYKKLFLMSLIDLGTKTSKGSSLYKIYNKVDSFKKFLFLLSLIENIINKK